MDMITPYGKSNNPRYKLQIVLQSPLIEQKAIRRDETATFATVKNTADYTLIDIETGKELLKSLRIQYLKYFVKILFNALLSPKVIT